jgi:hypothetical protein
MRDTFDIQSDMYKVFTSDDTLLTLMGLQGVTDDDILSQRIRKVFADTTIINEEETRASLPFFDFTVLPMRSSTGNFLVIKPLFEFNIYTGVLSDTIAIYKRLKALLGMYFDDSEIIYEGQGSSGIIGIVKNVFRIHQLAKS